MIKKITYAFIVGSLLLGSTSCKKENITPRNTAFNETDSEEVDGEEKNNGTIYFTRCPNVKKQNLGCDIWMTLKANDPNGVSSGIDDVQIFILDWTTGPAPLEDGFSLEEVSYSEDGLFKNFQTPDGFILFDQGGGSPVEHTYTFQIDALDATGGVIESMVCAVEVTEPFQNGIKGKRTKVIENNDGTAELQTIVNPRSYIDQGWISSDQLNLTYDQLPANALLIPGVSYTLEYAGMKDNGNLLFSKTLSGAGEYNPTASTSISEKRTITELEIEPTSISIYRPSTQQTLACSKNGMKLIDKGFNSYINNISAIKHNNGTITVKVKRTQKALVDPGKTISYAKITLINANDTTIQESFIRYEWDFDGDGINNYPQSNIDDLLAGLWDFDGDELNDYEAKMNFKISNLPEGHAVFNNSTGGANDSFYVRVKLVGTDNSSYELTTSDSGSEVIFD